MNLDKAEYFDVVCIGLGPAGMAVSILAAEIGLRVCAIEKDKVGGECLNVGCIPSKSLLRMSKNKYAMTKLKNLKLTEGEAPELKDPFTLINEQLDYISHKKTLKMFDKVQLIVGEGEASFIDSRHVKIGDRIVTGRNIFIASGTLPVIPDIPGINDVDLLTNQNLFQLSEIPSSMTIIGGGTIGCEMAQAFAKLGTKCNIVHKAEKLIPMGDDDASKILEEVFIKEGIKIYNGKEIEKITKEGNEILVHTTDGIVLKSEKLLLASGREIALESLKLENTKVKYDKKGIKVNNKQKTTESHIYAVGDCTGGVMLSHAAMHQGMFAIMNAISPFSLFQYKNYVIPWTIFTDPAISHVGMTPKELKEKKIKYKTYTAKYEDYGSAIAEDVGIGFVKVYANYFGRVYGVSIVGEGSGEMINEWALIIQQKIRLHSVMFLAHSFPTMGFLSKRVAEMWMMEKMESKNLRKFIRVFYKRM
ncbi:MAG TPA: NAD(P)/FAD-dependent oxidoreductase [Campylobacterales bacterium]|nr:NAD(P)/FAD-dependent oxidoreductase [Campylobacterales bacterium]